MINELLIYISALLPKISHLGFFAYWLVAGVTFLESIAIIGTFIPGAIIIAFFGFLAGQDYFDFGDLIWYAAIGAILGDIISYYFGKYGKKIFKPKNRIFKTEYLLRGERFFKRHGAKSVFLGRFLAVIRPNISFIAGLFKMDAKKFYFYNITSAFLWSLLYLTIGYFVGQTTASVVIWSTRIAVFVLSIILFLLLIDLIRYLIIKYGKPFYAFCKSIAISIKEAIFTNPDVKRALKKHPRFFGFLGDRLEIRKFTGLPLALLCVLFIYFLSLYFDVTSSILRTTAIVEADLRIEKLVFVFREGNLINFFTWITLLGEWQFVMCVIVIICIIFWLYKKKEYILSFLITTGGTAVFGVLSKAILHRPRPEMGLIEETSFSFPSNHAGISMAIFGYLIYYICRNTKPWKTHLNVFFGGLVIIIAVGFSRIYLGVHYLSDVIGGYLLGLLFLLIGITINEWLIHKKIIKRERIKHRKKIHYIFICLIILIGIIYFCLGIFLKPEISPKIEKIETPITISGIINISPIFENNNLPKYSETLIGTMQEPLQFIILAKNENDFINIFTKAGWHLAEEPDIFSVLKIAKYAAFNEEYLTAPMTPSFWDGEVHESGFQKPTETNSVRSRHHVRFWKTNITSVDGKKVYVGTASLDTNIKWIVVHKIDPNIDAEREIIFKNLLDTGLIKQYQKEQFVTPFLGENFARDQFFTDGQIYVIELK
ncbi:LssY C-terminal domain-containing protein [Candidatus Falkowbacteria bacterium]|nr:LssY C-terminal domain-containing protein [Candidatus Falkowbacteria bacterium]